MNWIDLKDREWGESRKKKVSKVTDGTRNWPSNLCKVLTCLKKSAIATGAEAVTRLLPETGIDGRVGECCGVVEEVADP